MKKVVRRYTAGILTGAVNGLFGGGGGMVAVPLLKKFCRLGERESHATAIFIIAPVCAASAIVYIINGYADLSVIIPAAIGSVFGGICGAKLLNKFPAAAVKYIFAAVMLIAGVRMLF